MGYGITMIQFLNLMKKENITLHYDLGVSEENPNVRFVVPSKDTIRKT